MGHPMTTPTRSVAGYLSRVAAQTWPGAVVYEEPDGRWTLERPEHPPVYLGTREETYTGARDALRRLAAAVRAGSRQAYDDAMSERTWLREGGE